MEHTFTITGRGLVVSGQFADDGSIRVGSRVELPDGDSAGGVRLERVTGVEMGHGRNEDGTVRGFLGLVLGELLPSEISTIRQRISAGTTLVVRDPGH